MDGDFGPWTCNTNCCTTAIPPCVEICCEVTSISMWFQYNLPEYLGWNCTECNSVPFEVTLTSEACPEPLTQAAVDEFLNWTSLDFCESGITFGDEVDCGLGSTPPAPIFECVYSCYSASFSGPCFVCEPDGIFETVPWAARVEYEIRAIHGFTTSAFQYSETCITALTVLKRFYYKNTATDCDSLEPSHVTLDYYLFNHGRDGIDLDCPCGVTTIPFVSGSCTHYSGSLGCTVGTFTGCVASQPPSTPGHPEYQSWSFEC